MIYNPFQFHNGSIKTTPTITKIVERSQFQFHNGSIKTFRRQFRQKAWRRFQFHNGSIKTKITFAAATLDSQISIPQWFN